MSMPIELFVDLRVLYPKVGAEIEHPNTSLQQRNSLFGRDTMRQGEKRDVGPPLQSSDVWCFELELAQGAATIEPRKNIGGRFACCLSRGESHNLDQRMLCQTANELFPRVTGGAEDSSTQFVHWITREVSCEKESEDRLECRWLQGCD